MTTEKRKEILKSILSKIDRKGIKEFENFLINDTDYLTAPASKRFHSNYDGGLFDHSYNVTKIALNSYEYLKKIKPEKYSYEKESVVLCGMFHDLCKCNTYAKELCWIKDNDSKWVSYMGYTLKDDFPFGHGEKSALMINKYIELTDEELLTIRWHMGAFDSSFINNRETFSNACNKTSLLFLIASSDSLSTTIENTLDYKGNII